MKSDKEIDDLLTRTYWAVRFMSVIEYPKQLNIIFQDVYSLLANLEVYYFHRAIGNLKDRLKISETQLVWINPYLPSLRLVENKLYPRNWPTKRIVDFMSLYGVAAPKNGQGINLRTHHKWINYPKSIKELGNKILETNNNFYKESNETR
jgi:hypothetical protein